MVSTKTMVDAHPLTKHRDIQSKPTTTFPSKLPTPPNMRAGLNFIVPITCLLSMIPAALAWSHGSRQPGNSTDADFFQSIAGSLLQLLGLLTFIWPTLSHPRLVGHSWWYTWILAVSSAICAVLCIPLYLVVPSTWSFAVGFTGAIAQAVVQLQVINAV